ncbi:hypothetical protein BH09SUM1_BH09SUM1_33250 [soil metagenome]
MKSLKKGFTLIELLIVVAIIAILAAIAVPNFLEAQVRAKVARVKSDMRSVTTALETYRIDANRYPPMSDLGQSGNTASTGFHARVPSLLSTPIAYITSLPFDVFLPKSTFSSATYPESVGRRFAYFNYDDFIKYGSSAALIAHRVDAGPWLMYSYGPDKDVANGGAGVYVNYDATNGTVSTGNIFRTQRTSERYIVQ